MTWYSFFIGWNLIGVGIWVLLSQLPKMFK